ncbi:hypothetical protein [Rufibacter hautae]|uniref:Lipid/polyisoprenoid-binding YceI-like domain-containing protein n=1 Tax=Rufibacter hautae TaxID=2595005 RepID=A0A5B6TK02_9BACT|nr:hypothetical protein [Rufibacter hautae]KAA3440603.1 hypothetical protein FOA19_08110 [Rufibacter hautae]
MKNSTQKFRLLVLLFCSFLAVSCSKDDDDEEVIPPLENQLEYNDVTYDLATVLSVDLGAAGFSTTETHYGQAFILSDYVATGTAAPKVILELYMFSKGAASFGSGTFEFADVELADAETKYKDKNFFFDSNLLIDLNGDEEMDEDKETFMIKSGTIKMSGSGTNYNIECDVTLENNKGLRAQYSGVVTPITIDGDEEDPATAGMRKAPKSFFSLSKALKGLKLN